MLMYKNSIENLLIHSRRSRKQRASDSVVDFAEEIRAALNLADMQRHTVVKRRREKNTPTDIKPSTLSFSL